MPFEISGVADAVYLVEVYHFLCGDLVARFNRSAHGADLAVFYIGDGEVCAGDAGLVKLIAAKQVVKAVYHTVVDAGVGVGCTEVDGVFGLVADIGTGLLCDLDYLVGGDDILGVVEVNKSDCAHVGAYGNHARGELDCNVLMTGVVFDIPDLFLVAYQNAGAFLCADRVVDVKQQLNALLCRACFAEQNGGHVAFAHSAADHRVNGLKVAAALPAECDHCGNGNTLFVCAAFLHRSVGVSAVAVGADAAEIVIARCGVGVAVVAEGVGKAVAALIYAACRMLAVFADIGDLVIAVGVVLTSCHKG